MKYIKLPNLFLVGAPKSGTTYLASCLARHKDIYVPDSKEPAFLTTDRQHGQFHKGWNFYKKNFENAKNFSTIVDASTRYFYDSSSTELIKNNFPSARIIIILRNPVDRVYSNYWQYCKSGFNLPDFNLLVREKGSFLNHMLYISRYQTHLNRWLDNFDSDQIRVFSHNDLVRSPQVLLKEILEFLNLRDTDPSELIKQDRSNPAGIPKNRLFARLLRQKFILQKIKEMTPSFLIPRAKSVLEKLRWKNTLYMQYPPMSWETRRLLWEELWNVPEDVERLVGLDTEVWKRDRDL